MGSSITLRNSCTFNPYMWPSRSITPNAPRQAPTVVKRPGAPSSESGQSSSTTGGGTGRQSMPPVGMSQPGRPMFSPTVKYES